MVTVVAVRGIMSQNEQWANCIRELLDSHNLSVRGAAVKAGRPNLRTYLADWLNGQLPQYKTAVDFLRHFPKEEAVKCLEAGGYPIPDAWRRPTNTREAVMFAMDATDLTEDDKKQVLDVIDDILKRKNKKI